MKLFLALLLFTNLTGVVAAATEPVDSRRRVELELTAVEGASAYDVEVIPLNEISRRGKSLQSATIRSATNNWKAKLPPGQYKIRFRSLDSRGVPGDWSEKQDLTVALPAVKIIKPAPGGVIASESIDEESVEFSWEPLPGAHAYRFYIWNETWKKNAETQEASLKINLKVAEQYQWRVEAFNAPSLVSEEQAPCTVKINGGPLPSPKLDTIDPDGLEKIEWRRQEPATSVDYKLAKFDPLKKSWVELEQIKALEQNSVPWNSQRPRGRYRVQVRANAPLFRTSQEATQEFNWGISQKFSATDLTQIDEVSKANVAQIETDFSSPAMQIVDFTNGTIQSVPTQQKVLISSWTTFWNKTWGAGVELQIHNYELTGISAFYPAALLTLKYRTHFNLQNEVIFEAGLYDRETLAPGAVNSGGHLLLRSVQGQGVQVTSRLVHLFSGRWWLQAPLTLSWTLAGQASAPLLVRPQWSAKMALLPSFRISKSWAAAAGVQYSVIRDRYAVSTSENTAFPAGTTFETDLNEVAVVSSLSYGF